MSQLSEKIAFLRGAAEGMKLDYETNEGKLLKLIIEALDEVSQSITAVVEEQEELNEYIESIDEDLEELEELMYGDEEQEEDQSDDDDESPFVMEVTCPLCGENFILDDDLDEDKKEICPSCGKEIIVTNIYDDSDETPEDD